MSLALGVQIRDREGEHARALLAAKTKAKQAAEEMLKLRESHAAAVESLHAAHSAALQQQKDALEQALTVRIGRTHCMQCSPHSTATLDMPAQACRGRRDPEAGYLLCSGLIHACTIPPGLLCLLHIGRTLSGPKVRATCLQARMETEVEEIRKQIRVEVMHEILEDPAYTVWPTALRLLLCFALHCVHPL